MVALLQVLAFLRGLFELFKFGKEVFEDEKKCPTENKEKKSDEKPSP